MPNTEKADNGTSDFNELGGKGARDGDGRVRLWKRRGVKGKPGFPLSIKTV